MIAQRAVACDEVTKVFRSENDETHALRGVNFAVHLGEMSFLVGPSGSGKTTLLSIIATLLDASSGQLEVLGTDIRTLTGKHRVLFRRRNLGFVFQSYNLLPSLTASENAAVPLMIDGVPRAVAVGKAEELLERLGLGQRMQARPTQLSGGEQQRVAIARALIHDPRLVLCDEPTAALDGDMGRSVMESLAQVAVQPNRAVIIVTHDSRIFQFADAIAFMGDGRILRKERRGRDGRVAAAAAVNQPAEPREVEA